MSSSLKLNTQETYLRMTQEVEIAEQKVNEAIIDLWNSLDAMTIGEATAVFLRIRRNIDEHIQELGH